MWLIVEWIFLLLSVSLFVGAIFRLRATADEDEDFSARKRTAALLFLMVMGTAGSIARDKVPEFSNAYWTLNVLLLPLACVAAYLLKSLFADYKR
ncbi:MAG: hypothetical protein H7308_02455 [Chthonomonadaceae bacterium]|nr:hypothetical protein [Chthonomonadaceae bacterium]